MKNIKKILLMILMMIIVVPVFAEEQSIITKDPETVITEETEKDPIIIKSVQAETEDKEVQLRKTDEIDIVFNELNQTATYTIKLENTSDEILYVNDLEVENLSEEFINFSLSPKSVNAKVEPGKSKNIKVIVKTLDISQAGRNVSDDVTLKFILSREVVKNPETGSNWIVYLILVITLFITFSTVFSKVNKKKKLSLIMIGLLCGTLVVSAKDTITVCLTGKVTYISQNIMQESGAKLEGYKVSYVDALDIWKYAEQVKNIIISDDKAKPEDYEHKYDLSSNNSKKIYGYLTENGDGKTPYDLYIVANGVIYAPEDATGLFSFPNVEKIQGLEFIEFENTKNMTAMFYGNENLKSANVKSIDTSNATNTSYMFNGCNKLSVSEKDFNLVKVTNKAYMFNQKLSDIVKVSAKSDKDVNFATTPTKGKYYIESTKNDKNPVYYYRGAVTDNNVLFANKCWKMVRTTETGGTKLIYNGTPKNTTSATTLTRTNYILTSNNSTYPYSYNSSTNKWTSTNKNHNSSSAIEFTVSSAGNHIINYTISSEGNYDKASFYIDGSLLKTVSGTETSAINLGYLTTSNKVKVVYSKDGSVHKGNDNVVFYVAKGTEVKPTCNNTGTASQIGTSAFNSTNASPAHVGYMYGTAYTTTTKVLTNQNDTYLYGNDVSWDGSKYTLTGDTMSSSSWSTDKTTLSTKYHYTCFNDTGTCENVYYINYFGDASNAYYLTLKDGKNKEKVKEEMFTNTTDSKVKTTIDNWYKANMTLYTSQLEDTVWCNDRTLSSGPLSSKDAATTATSIFTSYDRNTSNNTIKPSLSCPSIKDRFTVDSKNGNGKLTYPVGLLTVDEYTLAGSGVKGYSSIAYLNIGQRQWTMSPSNFSHYNASTGMIDTDGKLSGTYAHNPYAIRPSISLKIGTDYVYGTGTTNDPYIVE